MLLLLLTGFANQRSFHQVVFATNPIVLLAKTFHHVPERCAPFLAPDDAFTHQRVQKVWLFNAPSESISPVIAPGAFLPRARHARFRPFFMESKEHFFFSFFPICF